MHRVGAGGKLFLPHSVVYLNLVQNNKKLTGGTMKFNKWTVGLAAVGLVSLSSAVKAEDTASTVLTALSSTTLSGYLDTAAQWYLGTGNANNPHYACGGASKADGLNRTVVQLSLDKPLKEC